MTYYSDLAREAMVDAGPHIRAIGWLDDAHEFPTGAPPRKFVARLRKLIGKCDESIQALGWGVMMGFHRCELCREFTSHRNLGVPADDLLYVTPEMITHYVEEHEYLPPREFIDAVLASPMPGTEEYASAVAHFRELHKKYQEGLHRM